jgi:hypothetical protein
MPLLDHFHAPVYPGRRWESFHSRWANSIADYLNRYLPEPRYFSEIQLHLGATVVADVAEFENRFLSEVGANGPGGGVAVQTWAPPAATHVIPAVFPDAFEVEVYDTAPGGAHLVAVVELVSPGNKDAPDSRRAFAAKCAAYLQRGVGLVVADVVTEKHFNLHDELIRLLELPDQFRFAEEAHLYATAYRPARRDGRNEIDIWAVPLSVGETLPMLPLALRTGPSVPLDLEVTYTDARQRGRL